MALKEKSALISILLPRRTIYFRTFQCETPCRNSNGNRDFLSGTIGHCTEGRISLYTLKSSIHFSLVFFSIANQPKISPNIIFCSTKRANYIMTLAPGLLAKDSYMNTPYNSTLDIMYNSSLCESLCPREGVNQLEIEAYCNNLQYYIAADTHIAMWTAIGVLFGP